MKGGGLVTRIAAFLALAALGLGGGAPAVVAGIVALGLLMPCPPVPPRYWAFAHVAVIVAGGGVAVAVGAKEALALLVGWLLLHRGWTGSSAGDARIVLLFSTLLALLACLRSESVVLGGVLIAFCATLPAALLRVEVGDAPGRVSRSVLAGVAVLALAAGLFLVLPRLRGGYFAQGGGIGGTGATVTLGDDDRGGDSEAVLARVRVIDDAGRIVPGPHRLRGRSLDTFDGRTWTTSRSASIPVRLPRPAPDARAEVHLEPLQGGILYGPPGTVGVTGVDGRVWEDHNGAWHHQLTQRPLDYVALVHRGPVTEPPTLDDDTHDALLQLPDLDPRVITLAWSIESDTSDPRRVAQALTDALSSRYRYVESPPPPDGDPLASFLFETQRGHCEYFASALVVMLRVRGVPARLATGFYTDELDADGGTYVARASAAHAWVEVPLSSGWTVFDPSPLDATTLGGGFSPTAWIADLEARWAQIVIAYDLGDQFNSLDQLGRSVNALAGQSNPRMPAGTGFLVVMAGMGVLYAGAVLAQLFGSVILIAPEGGRPDRLGREVARAREVVARKGYLVPHGLPALAAGEWLVREAGAAGEPLRELAWIVYEARYDAGTVTPDTLAKARGRVQALRDLPPRV